MKEFLDLIKPRYDNKVIDKQFYSKSKEERYVYIVPSIIEVLPVANPEQSLNLVEIKVADKTACQCIENVGEYEESNIGLYQTCNIVLQIDVSSKECNECQEELELAKEEVFSVGDPFVVNDRLDTWSLEQIISLCL